MSHWLLLSKNGTPRYVGLLCCFYSNGSKHPPQYAVCLVIYIYIQFNQLNYRALFCTTTSTWIPNTKTKATTNLSDTTACFSGVVIPLHHHEHAVDSAFLMWVTTHLLNLDAKTCPNEASEDDWAAEHLFIHEFLLGIRRCQVQRWAYDSQVVAMRRTEQGWNLILPVLIWFQLTLTYIWLYGEGIHSH